MSELSVLAATKIHSKLGCLNRTASNRTREDTALFCFRKPDDIVARLCPVWNKLNGDVESQIIQRKFVKMVMTLKSQ